MKQSIHYSNKEALELAKKDIIKYCNRSKERCMIHLFKYSAESIKDVVNNTVMLPSYPYGKYTITKPFKVKNKSSYAYRGSVVHYRCAAPQL